MDHSYRLYRPCEIQEQVTLAFSDSDQNIVTVGCGCMGMGMWE